MNLLIRITTVVFFCVGLLGNVGCNSDNDPETDMTVSRLQAQPYPDSQILPGIYPNAYTLKNTDYPYYRTRNSDYTGRLDFFNGDNSETQRKFLLHLEGDHFEMGFQHGYLLAPIIRNSINESSAEVIKFYFVDAGIEVPPPMMDLFIGAANITTTMLATTYEAGIPEPYRNEMKGIAMGVRKGLKDRGVTQIPSFNELYYGLIKLNLGPDIALAYYNQTYLTDENFQVGTPTYAEDKWPDVLESSPHACDGFVVTGTATVDDKTIMGRNFMYTDKPWWKYGIITEYYPRNTYQNGKSSPEIPHVGVGVAGFIGILSGMNSEGLGIGMNLTISSDSDFTDVGMGAGIASRKILAEKAELTDAVLAVHDPGLNLGAPLLFTIADGIGDIGAAVVAKAASNMSTIRWIDDPDPQSAVEYYDKYYPNFPNPFSAPHDAVHVHQENEHNVLVTSNFFMKSEMYEDVKVEVVGNNRYNKLLSLLDTAIETVNDSNPVKGVCYDNDHPACIGVPMKHGEKLVNYLRDWDENPNPNAWFTTREIMATSVTLFNLTDLRMKTKYSKYEHDFVEYCIRPDSDVHCDNVQNKM